MYVFIYFVMYRYMYFFLLYLYTLFNIWMMYIQCIDYLNDKFRIFLGLVGKIISSILEVGFEILMLEMFNMEKVNAEEFYEVYKGVVQEYGLMVVELILGSCFVMEIRVQNVFQVFREMVGFSDSVRISVFQFIQFCCQ